MINPKPMRMTPENISQNNCGTMIKTVLALRRRVESITEMPSDIEMVYALLRSPDATEPPTIMGSKGSTHGAMAVRTPAIKEIRKRIMRAIEFLPRQKQLQ